MARNRSVRSIVRVLMQVLIGCFGPTSTPPWVRLPRVRDAECAAHTDWHDNRQAVGYNRPTMLRHLRSSVRQGPQPQSFSEHQVTTAEQVRTLGTSGPADVVEPERRKGMEAGRAREGNRVQCSVFSFQFSVFSVQFSVFGGNGVGDRMGWSEKRATVVEAEERRCASSRNRPLRYAWIDRTA